MSIKLAQRTDRKRLFLVVAALLTLYVFVPRLSTFQNSFSTLLQADFTYIGVGIAFWLSTFWASALVYKLIAPRQLSYWRTLLIQLASGFTNRLAPAGAGAIAINVRYLIKGGHSAVQAAVLTALNNLLGFAGNAVLLLVVIICMPHSLDNSLKIQLNSSVILIVIILTFVSLVGFMAVFGSKLVQKIRKTVRLLVQTVFHQPIHLMLAFLASMAITAGYTLVLYSMGLAFNAHLSLVQSLFVLTVGVLAATITPTPGGLVGAEAGLVAALISVGVSSHQALTVALTYRFLVYWLPIVPGFICFQFALRHRYI